MIDRFMKGTAKNTTYLIYVHTNYNVMNLAEVSGVKSCSLKASFWYVPQTISVPYAQDSYNVDALKWGKSHVESIPDKGADVMATQGNHIQTQ